MMITVLLLVFVIVTHYTSLALISIQPTVIIRQPGQELSIECNSSSDTTAVQWTLPNNIVKNSTGRVLVIENVTLYESGLYECSVNGESAGTNVFIC